MEEIIIIAASVLLRLLIGSFPHSGENKPPLFGDYEAQRHWMEITINLPVQEWYEHTENNDLLYWGLDYPPLSAYFSFCVGKIIEFLEPESVELFTSRGYVTPTSKLIMRASVIFSDIILVSAIWSILNWLYPSKKNRTTRLAVLSFVIFQPSMLIIDHGHFQYNNCSIGLIAWAIRLVLSGHFLIASILYSLAVQYKIISLYFAPGFFCFFLGSVFRKYNIWVALKQIISLIIVAVSTTVICWLPFLYYGKGTALQVLARCFPVYRGLYEDKVANLWCSLSPVLKLKDYPISLSVKICLVVTAISLVPACLRLLFKKTVRTPKDEYETFLLGLLSVSLSYFLFSFHVHEKTILFPLLPATLLVGSYPFLSFHVNLVGMWSMFTLMHTEGLMIPYVSLITIHAIIFISLPHTPLSTRKWSWILLSNLGFFCILIGQLFIEPPARYQSLFPLLITTYCAAHFISIFLYINVILWAKTHSQSKSSPKLKQM